MRGMAIANLCIVDSSVCHLIRLFAPHRNAGQTILGRYWLMSRAPSFRDEINGAGRRARLR